MVIYMIKMILKHFLKMPLIIKYVLLYSSEIVIARSSVYTSLAISCLYGGYYANEMLPSLERTLKHYFPCTKIVNDMMYTRRFECDEVRQNIINPPNTT